MTSKVVTEWLREKAREKVSEKEKEARIRAAIEAACKQKSGYVKPRKGMRIVFA